HFELGAAMLGGADQTLEIVTTMRHVAPGASSNQVVRSVLGGRATGSYLGKVAVARHAQKTDASQSVKAMLLARTATANAKP
ncbi:SufD family Fe-S cluster assembly protein, partial [Acinetobacter baumannii]